MFNFNLSNFYDKNYFELRSLFIKTINFFLIPHYYYDLFFLKITTIYDFISTIDIDEQLNGKNFFFFDIKNKLLKNIKNKFFNYIINIINYFIKLYYIIIIKYILTPIFIFIKFYENFETIYQNFIINNSDFYIFDLIYNYYILFFL